MSSAAAQKVRKLVNAVMALGGGGGTGKTTLCDMYFKHKPFQNDYNQTQAINVYKATMSNFTVGTKTYNFFFQVNDFAGQPIQRKFAAEALFPGSSSAIVLYAVDNQNSFDDVDKGSTYTTGKNTYTAPPWVSLVDKPLKDGKQSFLSRNHNLVFLVANKDDLVDTRVVTPAQGIEKAKKFNLGGYLETSAKDGHNVDVAFKLVTCNILLRMNEMTFDDYVDVLTTVDEDLNLQEKKAKKKEPYHYIAIPQSPPVIA